MATVKPFLIGAVAGAAAALLLAPQSGEQTRALVTEKAGAVASEAKDFGTGLPGTAQDVLKTVQDKGMGLVGGAAPAAPATADADELREKIEAARQRIAAQVMANAEEGKAAAEETVEAVAAAE